MEKPFVYGMSVEGNNFTDRVKETARLKKDFEHGINVILISPRRMGKTSLVRKVCSEVASPTLRPVMMDVYDCRSEYDFYNRFAESILKQTAGKAELVLEQVKKFLVRVSPKISFSPEPLSDFSLSLGITPKDYTPEEILELPEAIARSKGIHIVVCIDEFQQIGEFPESLSVQKRLRGMWQHQQHVSYCLFGSKKHLMTQIFQSREMPFYQFGEINELGPIPTADWIAFIQSRFRENHQIISPDIARKICETVENYSSYVQQLAWNVMAEAGKVVTDDDFSRGFEALMAQNSNFFEVQIRGLSSYQMNFIRAICSGVHDGFSSKEIMTTFPMGTKSNIPKIRAALLDRELIVEEGSEVYIADCIFVKWFTKKFM
jgi:hypothetical protein